MVEREGYTVEPVGERAVARVVPGPVCAFCEGTGRRTLEMRGVQRVGRCRCQKIPDRVILYNRAQIPARYAESTMATFRTDLPDARAGWTMCRNWLDRYRPGEENAGLILSGEPGRGKTHLLSAVLRELIFQHGVSCRFVEFTHLISSIKEGFDRKESEATTLTPLVRVPVLAVDELGKGRRTEFEVAVLDEIITRRYNARGTLLATTNYPLTRRAQPAAATLALPGLESLSERLGDRIFSRLKESNTMITVGGEDYRVTHAQRR